MNWLASLWCRAIHRRLFWPVNGKYVCSVCGRAYRVNWTVPGIGDPVAKRMAQEQAEREELAKIWRQ